MTTRRVVFCAVLLPETTRRCIVVSGSVTNCSTTSELVVVPFKRGPLCYKNAIKAAGVVPQNMGPMGNFENHEIGVKNDPEIPAEKLNIPAQIILYGDKTAITNFKDSMLTVVIDSKYIHETFRKIFEYVWNH